MQAGDIISVDFGTEYNGFYGDSAVTLGVGKISHNIKRLLRVTEESLNKGIEQVVVGQRIGDISVAIQKHVEDHGFSIVRQFVGHGIGSSLHEAPEIPNFFHGEGTARLMPGMVLAIEPMVNMGSAKVEILSDGWTVVTKDRKPSVHVEHTVAISEGGGEILTIPYDF